MITILKKQILKTSLKIYHFFISLKLAVFILSSLAVLTAIGTFVEARYDQEWANKLVYHSVLMMAVMFLLTCNLAMVLIDRWPWKKKHIPFVMAHIGILIVLLGSIFTKYFGFDGSLRFAEGKSKNQLSLQEMEIKIYSSYDGENFRLLYEKPIDFFFKKPNSKKPYHISTSGEHFFIEDYLPFAIGRESFRSTIKGGSPAVRFQLSGSQAQAVEWILLDKGTELKKKPFGPAFITLTTQKNYKAKSQKELVLFVNKNKLSYSLNSKPNKALKKGQVFATGWMDLTFRLIEFFPKAKRVFLFEKKDKPSDSTLKAIQIRYQGEKLWIGQNSYARFFKEDQVYALAYLNKTWPLGFDIKLKDFRIETYPGSQKAKSYESLVELEGQEILISMNQPLKHKGWTFYQSSFEAPEKEGEKPKVSILSVNRDPGRVLKYTGSLVLVIGIILLFYRRR